MTSPSKNIFWLSASRVIALVLLFLAYRSLFRYLGPYSFGQFQFVLSYCALFGVIIDFGIQQYIIKKMSEDKSRVKEYFHNFLAVEVLLVILVFSAMTIIAKANGYEPIVFQAIVVAGIGIVLTGLTYPFLSVLSSFYDLRKVAALNLLSSAVNAGMIYVTIATGHGIVLLVFQQIIYAVLALIIYYYFVQKHIGKPQILRGISKLNWSLVKKIFIAAFPFALLVGFSTVYNRIDVILITKILGYAETGFYTAAYKLFDLLAFFPAVVSHVLYPLFASLMSQGKITDVRATMERYLRLMMAIALPMAVGGTIFSEQIISFLAGPEFAPAAPVLAILVWAPAILFIYIVANSIVISQLTKFAMVITGVNVFVNIIGNILLLPYIGIKGAAIMTVVSEALQGIFYFYFVRRRITDYKFFSLIWKPVLASALMGFALWQLHHQSLFIVVPIGGLIYFVLMLLLRFFKKDDWTFIKSLLGRAV